MNKTIAPSILAADFGHLADEVQRAEEAGADMLHVDIMDGHFVPNISIGPAVVAAINRSTDLPLHVHLMIYNPFGFVEQFVRAGADLVSFHFEATEDVEETLNFIKTCGVRAGIAINPETPVSFLPRFFPLLDEVLIMSVNPGFGGQKFLPEVIDKIAELKQYIDERTTSSHPITIAVDGGIDEKSAKLCAEAGASCFAAGTALFQAPDMKVAVEKLRESVS